MPVTKRGRLELTFLRAVKLAPAQPVDRAAMELGVTVARAIDAGNLRLVNRYLEVLTALGMTPKSRGGGMAEAPKVSALDELRSRRAAQ